MHEEIKKNIEEKQIKKNIRKVDTFEDYNSSTFIEDSDGFLSGRAVVTTIGVFPYLTADGSVFNELRLPEEVFSYDSLNSLKLKPITNDHPNSLVTSDNIKDLQVGTTGEDVSRFNTSYGEIYNSYKTEGTTVSIPLKITDSKTIDMIKNGKRSLSCGYTCDVEMSSGNWCGIPFDGIQRNIKYNHVAIVDAGRAGDLATMRMDNALVQCYFEKKDDIEQQSEYKENTQNDRRNDRMGKIKLDSVEYEVPNEVATVLESLQKNLDSVNGELAGIKLQKEGLETEMKSMVSADNLSAVVKEFREVADTADKFGIKLDDTLSIVDQKRAILKVTSPTLQNLDSQSDSFINGAFAVCKNNKLVSTTKVDNTTESKTNTNNSVNANNVENKDTDFNKIVLDSLQKYIV